MFIALEIGRRRTVAKVEELDASLHAGLTRERRAAIQGQGDRAPAVALEADRVKADVGDDQTAMIIVAEVRPSGRAPYRVEIRSVVPDRDRHRGVGPLISNGTEFFVFIDHADPKTVVIDTPDLVAREKREEADTDARSREADAKAERENAERRDRLLRGG
jgi:hypothetical protein